MACTLLDALRSDMDFLVLFLVTFRERPMTPGAKEAESHPRHFDESTLKAGETILPSQAGEFCVC